ncbi:hypothetical protein PR202_ga07545 [Eleusine coracana subsp. coracana]|uniref:Uncharacterized protein n=1 Tax=Eleusine coracana subsp. coracana TaxID=191504 RepID=A0AAV5C107_ELECO|nr:hypothetical protein PR202_ga07545 [Eleusine coracana subsp. coracana]
MGPTTASHRQMRLEEPPCPGQDLPEGMTTGAATPQSGTAREGDLTAVAGHHIRTPLPLSLRSPPCPGPAPHAAAIALPCLLLAPPLLVTPAHSHGRHLWPAPPPPLAATIAPPCFLHGAAA